MFQEGSDYEVFCASYLKNKFSEVFLWKEIPKKHLLELKIIASLDDALEEDIGCDIICIDKDKKYHFIQCKNYTTSGKENTINIDDLSGFSYFIANHLFTNAYVYYSGKLSSNVVKRAKNIKFVKLPFILNTTDEYNNEVLPRYYQIDALNTLYEQPRGVLQMPSEIKPYLENDILKINTKIPV